MAIPMYTLKPGPKPDPQRVSTSATEVSRLHHELAGLRQENAALRQQRAPQQPPAEAAKLTREIAQLKAALKTTNSRIQQLNQQIKNLEAERDFWRSISIESGPSSGNGAITEKQLRTLRTVCHPDTTTNPKRKKLLEEAFKIISNLTVVSKS